MAVPDFSENDLWIIRQTLEERYGEFKDIDMGDAEVRLNPDDRELMTCPVVVWQDKEVTFVVFKLGERRFRPQFYYRGYQQYGAGRNDFDELTECVVAILQVQADHESQRQEASK